jgi:hypothetical protein
MITIVDRKLPSKYHRMLNSEETLKPGDSYLYMPYGLDNPGIYDAKWYEVKETDDEVGKSIWSIDSGIAIRPISSFKEN